MFTSLSTPVGTKSAKKKIFDIPDVYILGNRGDRVPGSPRMQTVKLFSGRRTPENYNRSVPKLSTGLFLVQFDVTTTLLFLDEVIKMLAASLLPS